jgi:hypothetical protein
MMKWMGHKTDEKHKILVMSSEGMRPLGKPRQTRDDIKLGLKETGQEGMTGFIWLRIYTIQLQ